MPQLGRDLIKQRAGELREAAKYTRDHWMRSLLGQDLSVLAERDGTGHAENFARVTVPKGVQAGEIVHVTPQSVEEGLLK